MTWIRFSENSAGNNQDFWSSSHLGGQYSPDNYYPISVSASCIAAYTGEMLIKRGTDNSGDNNTNWSSDVSNYGPVNYIAMEIQQ